MKPKKGYFLVPGRTQHYASPERAIGIMLQLIAAKILPETSKVIAVPFRDTVPFEFQKWVPKNKRFHK